MPYEKVGKNEPVCIADEVPFDIPESWEWVRLKDIVVKEIKRGKSPTYTDNSSVLVFAQKCNTKAGIIDLSLAKHLDFKSFAKYSDDEYMQDGDIVVNSTGNGTLGRVGVFHDSDRSNDCVIVPDSHVTTIRINKTLVLDYIYYALVYYQPYFEKSCSGSTNQTELKPLVIANLFIPVPPFKEQRRIIRKLSSVLPLVTKYDEKEVALEIYNTAFPAQLKKSILQDAVQGKLVSQNPADEPAAILLEHIRAEKEKLIKSGKIKRDKHESVIFRRDNSYYEKVDGIERCIDDELPFEIPDSWEWTTIGTTCINIQYGSSRKSESTGTMAVLRMGNIQNGRIDTQKLVYTSDKEEIAHYPLEYNDLLFNRTNSKELVGKTAIYKSEVSAIYAGYLIRITPLIDSDYLNYVMQTQFYWVYCQNVRSDAIGQSNINAEKLKNFIYPLPPLHEQKRIAKKLNSIFTKIK